MAVDPLSIWTEELEKLPPVGDLSWAPNFANWYADRIVDIEPDDTMLDVSTGFTFVFNTALFATTLALLPPVPVALAGITGLALAWETALLTTIYSATLNVSSGAFVPPASPGTIFSSVAGVEIDAASLIAGKAKIMELAVAPPTGEVDTSQFPLKFREATLLLTITVEGMDSTPSSSGGPYPLTAAARPLL